MKKVILLKFWHVAIVFMCLLLAMTLLVPIKSSAQTRSLSDEELKQMINDLMYQIQLLQAQLSLMQGGGTGNANECIVLTRSLYLGLNDKVTDGEVSKLQRFLTTTGDYTYGQITGHYGPVTQSAVQRWQSRNGLGFGTNGYGTVDLQTRQKINGICSGQQSSDATLWVKSPLKGEKYEPGKTMKISYEAKNLLSVSIALYQDSKWLQWIEKDMVVKSNGVGEYKWKIPSDIEEKIRGGENLQIYITASKKGGGYIDEKSGVFSIASPANIIVVSPNGGEKWQVGKVNTITWKPYSYSPNVNIADDVVAYLDKLVNGRFIEVGRILENGKASLHTHLEIDEPYNYAESGKYYVRIVNSRTGESDRSDKPFTVIGMKDKTLQLSLKNIVEYNRYTSGFVENVSATCNMYEINGTCDFVGHYIDHDEKMSFSTGDGTWVEVSFPTVRPYPGSLLEKISVTARYSDGSVMRDSMAVDLPKLSGRLANFEIKIDGKSYDSSKWVPLTFKYPLVTTEYEAYSRCVRAQDYDVHKGGQLECFWDGKLFYKNDSWKG